MRSFAATPDAPAQARRWAGSSVPDHLCEAVTLAVSELVTNALVHGRLSDDEAIEVGVLCGSERVRVWVAARGEPFAPLPATSAGADGGWGLWLVDSFVCAWGVSQQGPRTVVWFEV